MKATIKNNTQSPKAFYIGNKVQVIAPGEDMKGDFDDGLLQSLKNTGFDVDHKGELKLGDKAAKPDNKAAHDEAEKIIADAKSEAENILEEAKANADKIIAEAEELAKAEKPGKGDK